MPIEAKINKALVVLSPELIRPDSPMDSTLLRRAITLAKSTGCQLELFHACYDNALDYHLFASDDDARRQQEALTDRDATLLAEIATRLKSEYPNIRYEVRWDHPRTDAILRKIGQSRPDVVMKLAREHSYVIGLSTNTDWDLARRSPSNVWLVHDGRDDIGKVVTAVGNDFGDPGDVTSAADYDLFRAATVIAKTFGATIHPVNAYTVPGADAFLTSPGGVVMPIQPTAGRERASEERLKQHRAAVRAISQFFRIDEDNVRIREGHPSEVISGVAREVDADMIVMGAGSIGRLERVLRSVTVEPVMADTDCDRLIVRERDRSRVPDARTAPFYGVPRYDLEGAITDPQKVFRSPEDVAAMSEISIALRKRILQAWEYDIRAALTEENEGGPVHDVDVNALAEIRSAKNRLSAMQRKPGNGNNPTLSVASR
jgi:nucleotide-binding universal stress UspA family protein